MGSITNYFDSKENVARYVNDCLRRLEDAGSAWTMIIKPEKSEGYCVISVIGELSGGTETQNYLKQLLNI